MFLSRIREESSYPALRSFLDTVQNVGCVLGALIVLAGGYLAFAAINDDVIGNFVRVSYGVLVGVGGVLVIALSLAAYQASVVVVDIADVLIDQRTP